MGKIRLVYDRWTEKTIGREGLLNCGKMLTDEEADGGEHGDAAVRDLHVGVALRLGLVDAVEESEHVNTLGAGNLKTKNNAMRTRTRQADRK